MDDGMSETPGGEGTDARGEDPEHASGGKPTGTEGTGEKPVCKGIECCK